MAEALDRFAVWLSTPHQAMMEIARDIGYRHIVLDIEHGLFDLEATDRIVALGKALGLTMHAKVLGPEAIPIQQALDMGCDSVIIPHVGDVDHARRVTLSTKYPPLGTRSFSGTRPARYNAVKPDYYERENAATRCYPMVESAAALRDIEAILALPTVDGVFVGPSDLSLDSGRGAYRNTDADKADLARIAAAAKAAGKPWIMPAWTRAERDFAGTLGADLLVVADEFGSIMTGLLDAAR
ncbi:HpcH/HpaI aldolase family protein [Labrys wisconsinensis]|uniref:4-hydroxy-2-oxoheptanedioate aldolase n=1 Tax=Labrys wisconsinensis TaxID=425677 RepID=A0ABU0JEP3_9HYPH|nr:aldolase/citrate lyase family protein [Labrys wisconsinensis]MDQ0472751.1 4-hydroxy-2-oxoheptanedioate aldolase [Labrys wisconsinensis]